jgi:hypothetical protein
MIWSWNRWCRGFWLCVDCMDAIASKLAPTGTLKFTLSLWEARRTL